MSDRPLLLGHRGARATTSLPENSIASFDLALRHGCDGFEFDVHLTADGQGVICHDPRVAGVDVARASREKLAQLCTLDDVLARYPAAFLDIELKVTGLDDILLSALERNAPARFVVSSFLPEVLTSLHGRDARVPLGFICDRETYLPVWRELPVGYVIPHFKLVTSELVAELHGAGKKIFTWTVNDRERMLRLAQWGVDGIVSDDTQLLVKTLRSEC